MAAYASGERSAFDELFARYAPGLLRLLSKELARPEDAHDLVQQTFLQVHRHRRDYDVSRPFRPWIYAIALNLKREHFRRGRARPGWAAEASPEARAEIGAASPGQLQIEHRQRLSFALRALNEEQRDVILLHWIAGLPLSEIAVIVGVSLSGVKLRAHRGYAKMRDCLEEAEGSA